MEKSMTIREIAELCGVAESTIRNWIESAESADLSAKTADAAKSKKPAQFTLAETLTIIRAGGRGILAELLAANAAETRRSPSRPALSGAMIREARLAVEQGLLDKEGFQALLGVRGVISAPESESKALALGLPTNTVEKAIRVAMGAAGAAIRRELDKAAAEAQQGQLL